MKNYDLPVPMNDGVLRDEPGLEFPDWSGMLPHRTRKTFAEAVRWNDEMLSLFPPRKRNAVATRSSSCDRVAPAVYW